MKKKRIVENDKAKIIAAIEELDQKKIEALNMAWEKVWHLKSNLHILARDQIGFRLVLCISMAKVKMMSRSRINLPCLVFKLQNNHFIFRVSSHFWE